MKKNYYSNIMKISCLFAAVVIFLTSSFMTYAVEEGDDSVQAVAIVEVDNYSIADGDLEVGKDSTISITLHNTARNTQVNSLIMSMSSISGAIYPTYGTGNQIYIGTLEPDERKVVSMPITVDPDFNGKSADLSFKFVYVNSNKQLSNTVNIVLPILSGNVLEVKTLDMSAHATVNGKALLSLTVVNSSTFDVDDAVLVLDGKLSEDSKRIALETISAGKSTSKDCQISFTEAGDQSIDISLEFTDLNNNKITEYIGNYAVTVSDETTAKTASDAVDPQKKLFGRIIAMGAFVIAAMSVLIYLKKR